MKKKTENIIVQDLFLVIKIIHNLLVIHQGKNIKTKNVKAEDTILGKAMNGMNVLLSTNYNIRNNGNCFICGSDDHWVSKCKLG